MTSTPSSGGPAATAPAPTVGAGRHLAPLDGVRALAAVAVVLTHVGFLTGAVGPTVMGSLVARLDVGVALFFTLSGYLMLRPWTRAAIDRTDRLPSTGHYAMSRAARILPAYWIVAAVVLTAEATRVFGPGLRSTQRVDLQEVLTHAVVAQGITGHYFSSFYQSWSLTTEVTFYVAVPSLGVALVRLCGAAGLTDRAARVRRVEHGCLAVVALGVVAAAWSVTDLPGAGATLATSLLGHCAWFAGGAWTFARSQRRQGARTDDVAPSATTPAPWPVDRRMALAGVLLVLAASPLGGNLLFDRPSAFQAGTRELLYTLIGVLIVGAAASPAATGSVAARVLASRPLSWLGTRSYGLFLWHLPILFGIMTVLRLTLFEGAFLPVAVITLIVSIAAADLSWRFVERPVIDRVHHRRQRQQR